MITVEESHHRNVAPTTKFSCLHTYGKVDQLPHSGAAHFGIPSPYNQFLPLLGGVLSFGLFTRLDAFELVEEKIYCSTTFRQNEVKKTLSH